MDEHWPVAGQPLRVDSPRRTNVAPRSPRVNWTEALVEVLRDSRKGPKTIVPAKGERLIWLERPLAQSRSATTASGSPARVRLGQLQAIGLRYRLTRRGLNPSLLLQFDEPQGDIAVALAPPAHGREDGRGGPSRCE